MKKPHGLPTLKDLPAMKALELQAAHRELFGAVHLISNCQHLRRKIAWHLQAEKNGGLPESVRQYALPSREEQSCGRASRRTYPDGEMAYGSKGQ